MAAENFIIEFSINILHAWIQDDIDRGSRPMIEHCVFELTIEGRAPEVFFLSAPIEG